MKHIYEIVETSTKFPIKIWYHKFNTNKKMKPHFHDEMELVYIFEGSLVLHNEGEKKVFKKNEIHYFEFLENNTRLATLLLSNSIFKEFDFPYENYDFNISNLESKENLKYCIISLVENNDRKLLKVHNLMYKIYEILLDECCIKIDISDYTSTPIIVQIINYIDNNYCEDLTLKVIGEEFHFSEVYLSRMFKEKSGLSLFKYINKVRLNHAYMDLMNTDLSISAIALNNGFKNVKAFNKVFKEEFKSIPSKYRKG